MSWVNREPGRTPRFVVKNKFTSGNDAETGCTTGRHMQDAAESARGLEYQGERGVQSWNSAGMAEL